MSLRTGYGEGRGALGSNRELTDVGENLEKRLFTVCKPIQI
jgi:hypothetical protein